MELKYFVKYRMTESVKKECVSAKRTRKHHTFSTLNNLKIKRSFELSSCSKRTKNK